MKKTHASLTQELHSPTVRIWNFSTGERDGDDANSSRQEKYGQVHSLHLLPKLPISAICSEKETTWFQKEMK